MSAQREQAYYGAVKAANQKIWDGINELVALKREWVALDYSNTLDDGNGGNDGLVRADILAVVNTTADAFVALLGEGHGTNMARLL